MRKQVILGIALASAFLIGVLSANPVVEAVGGWQPAVDGLDARITALENQPAVTLETITVSESLFVPSSKAIVSETALCPAGTTVSGGGVGEVNNAATVIVSSIADTTQNGWKVIAKSNESVNDAITVNAVCIGFS